MSVRQLGYLDFPNMWQFLSWSQRPTHWACPFITHMHMCICTRAHAHTHTVQGQMVCRITNQRHVGSFDWHCSPERTVGTILSQGERSGSEVPSGLRSGPKWESLPWGKPVRSQLTDPEGEASGWRLRDMNLWFRKGWVMSASFCVWVFWGWREQFRICFSHPPKALDCLEFVVSTLESSINENVAEPEAQACWQGCCWQGWVFSSWGEMPMLWPWVIGVWGKARQEPSLQSPQNVLLLWNRAVWLTSTPALPSCLPPDCLSGGALSTSITFPDVVLMPFRGSASHP